MLKLIFKKLSKVLTTVDYFIKAEVPGENFDPLKTIIHCFKVYFVILEPKLLFGLVDSFAVFQRLFRFMLLLLISQESGT